jgi:hypothetical protein
MSTKCVEKQTHLPREQDVFSYIPQGVQKKTAGNALNLAGDVNSSPLAHFIFIFLLELRNYEVDRQR